MPHRRDSTTPKPGYASSHPTSGASDGRRSLSLVFRATTAQTVGAESPQSETSSQDTPIAPPMPPRRPSFPQLPPRNGGLRRQSTQRDTHETFGSALGQSKSPITVPMPTLLPPPSPVPPAP